MTPFRLALPAALVAASLVACAPGAVVVNAGNGTNPAIPGGGASPGTSASPAATTAPTTGASPTTTASASPAAAVRTDNDDFPRAAELSLQGESTSRATEKDQYFKVTVPAGKQDGKLTFTLKESDPNFTPTIEAYDGERASIASFYADGNAAESTSGWVAATAGKVYFLRIPPDAAAAGALLKVSATFTPVADANERNDDKGVATALTAGTAMPFYLFAGFNTKSGDQASTDHDWFKITAPAGKTKMRVKILNNSTAEEPKNYGVYTFNAEGEGNGDVLGANERANVDGTVDVAGGASYLLRVENQGGALTSHPKSPVPAEPSQLTVTFE